MNEKFYSLSNCLIVKHKEILEISFETNINSSTLRFSV